MSHRSFSVALTGAALVLSILALALPPVAAQARFALTTPKLPMAMTWTAYKATLPPYRPPRTRDGVPDLQGMWGGPGGSGGDDIEDHGYVDSTTPPQETFVSDPPDGKIPYTPWALARRNEHRAGLSRGWPGESGKRLYADPASYCFITIGPRGNIGDLIQQPGVVMFVSARIHRWIPIDGRPALNERAKFYRGVSRAHWEGETLTIEVTNLNGRNWWDSVGNFYSENSRMVERLRLIEKNTLDYSITIEDPTIYTRPWTMTFPIRRAGTGGTNNATGKYDWRDDAPEPSDPYQLETWENACNEGVGHTIVELNGLGFQWFTGVTPPR
ncbi:MAG: hypothetical protein EXQ53_02110 [Acidobacteria bacterium]|nr:hypothetical protein [Acidobacteriota bacterium]